MGQAARQQGGIGGQVAEIQPFDIDAHLFHLLRPGPAEMPRTQRQRLIAGVEQVRARRLPRGMAVADIGGQLRLRPGQPLQL